MPRRKEVPKREILPDPKYKSKLVAKFINSLMKDGKKSIAQSILYNCFDIMTEKANQDGFTLFKEAIDNLKPVLEVKSRRVGGSTYQVPVDVKSERRTTLSIRWVIEAAENRGERNMEERLANELIEASRNEGAAIRKKIDTHRMAEANKAFAHYRW